MTELDSLDFRADLMSGDTVAGHIVSHHVEPVCAELLPLCFVHGGDVADWLEHRAIDTHRTHSRLLKKALRLKERDDIATALHFNAATITDNYWVRPQGSALCWQDVRFRENDFADLALSGRLEDFSKQPSRTPELTNTGSFEKCWRFEDGAWWMYKAGSEAERFSELFVAALCRTLRFATAQYESCPPYIRTRDFTGGELNFEPAAYLVGDDEDYVLNYDTFLQYGQEIADQYVELLLMDTICRNVDRHTYNYGLLRDQKTGAVLRLAPNFDNNIALISGGLDNGPRKPDLLTELLDAFEHETQAISGYAARHGLPCVTAKAIENCCDATGMDAPRAYVREFVLAGYRMTPVPALRADLGLRDE